MFFLQDACLLTHALYFQSLLAGMTSETGEREEGGGKDGGGGLLSFRHRPTGSERI